MFDADITNTFVGRTFKWNRLSDVEPARLKRARDVYMGMICDREDYPEDDIAAYQETVAEIDAFFSIYGELLEQFA